ncbi:MAG TPA: glucuronate isomerase [Jiangellales bacterium]|nr:glucuronate isomerase [Jiangellales bacterium]
MGELPIISPHGHVPPQWLAEDTSFEDPRRCSSPRTTTSTECCTRTACPWPTWASAGRSSRRSGRATPSASCARAGRPTAGRRSSSGSSPSSRTSSASTRPPSEDTADEIYDAIDAALQTPHFRPRALYERFDIEFIATTDDPCDDLRHHISLANDPAWEGKVAPTFRPDKYLEPATPAWTGLVDTLGEVSGIDTGSYAGWVAAMEDRRAFFKSNGAVSTDHSHRDARVEPIPDAEAERLYSLARAGTITVDEGHMMRRTMVFQQARMASEDGLVMTMHPAVYRNHHAPTFEEYGADVGGDIPMGVEFVSALQPRLSAFGTAPDFQVVLFTIDETVYSRELAPLAGFYPSVYVGAPWWFIDSPEAMNRYRSAVTESAGFSRTSGFIDDTRAFLSIPARHDTNRRMDSGFLARLVADHRLTMDEALDTAHDLVVTNPRKAFKL